MIFVVQRLLLKTVWRTRTAHNTRLYPAERAVYPVWAWRGGRLKRLKWTERADVLVRTGKKTWVFFFTPRSGAPCHKMVKIPEVYWVQNVSVWLRKALSSINWFSSVIQQLQLTRCSDTSAIPAHCKHRLWPCALASAAAHAGPAHWAAPAFGLNSYGCFF